MQVAEVPLTKGYSALVDATDAAIVCAHSWYAKIDTGPYSSRAYAVARINGKLVKLHRFVMAITDPAIIVDHRNGNGLDCRRQNLRVASHRGNIGNQRKCRGTSRFKGVHRHAQTGKWRVTFSINGRAKHLGLFVDEIEAAKVYDAMAREYFGEFAATNF